MSASETVSIRRMPGMLLHGARCAVGCWQTRANKREAGGERSGELYANRNYYVINARRWYARIERSREIQPVFET